MRRLVDTGKKKKVDKLTCIEHGGTLEKKFSSCRCCEEYFEVNVAGGAPWRCGKCIAANIPLPKKEKPKEVDEINKNNINRCKNFYLCGVCIYPTFSCKLFDFIPYTSHHQTSMS